MRKKRAETIDWEKRDEDCLEFAKKAVEELFQTEGKPKRITPHNIRQVIGVKRWFNHQKLVKTRQYMEEVTEDIESNRERKIKWAIEEMIIHCEKLTVYKVQLKVGFGGGSKEIKKTITSVLREYELCPSLI